jgi:hypothetical protein
MARDKSARNPVLRRLTGSLVALLFLVGGVSMITAADWWAAEGVTSETGRSKARAMKAMLSWLFENIGQAPTGAVLAALGAISLVVIWMPVVLRRNVEA